MVGEEVDSGRWGRRKRLQCPAFAPHTSPPPPPHRNTTHPPAQEEYLSEQEFETVFGMDKEDFRAMPPWKRINLKKVKALF